jgi:ParB-like chromosome segregation protein Spo0J
MKEIIEESVEAASLPQTVGAQEDNQIEKPEMAAAVADGRPSAEEPKITTGMVSVERLQPYEKNAEIYREIDDPPFLKNIKVNGVMNALVVTEEGKILGGNRRWRAAKKADLQEVPVVVVSCKSEDEKLQRLLDDNLYREKKNEEKMREYIVQKKIKMPQAAVRKTLAGKTADKEGGEEEKGKSCDLAAEKFGLSGVSAEKGRKVVEAADKRRAEGDAKAADELLEILNKKGFDPALKHAKARCLLDQPEGKTDGKTAGNEVTAKPAPKTSGARTASTAQKVDNDAPKTPSASSRTDNSCPAPDDDDDEPSVDRIIAACEKVLEELEHLEVKGLTSDEKDGLQRAYNALEDWFAYNSSDF